MDKKTQIINEAITVLQERPLDAGHDLTHHKRVAQLSVQIAGLLNNPDINKEALEIAAMWHDVHPADTTSLITYLKSRLVSCRFPQEEISLIIECIATHSFYEEPTVIEAQILYDADKLDALTIERGTMIARSIMKREVSASKKLIYVTTGKVWLKEMRERLHFKITKEMFNKRIKTLLNSKEIESLALKLELDINDIKHDLFKALSIKEKFLFLLTNNLLKLKSRI